MDYPSTIKALEQKSSCFGKWQNEVAERLLGKKTASMGKYGIPATKTMEIRREEKHRRSSKRTRSWKYTKWVSVHFCYNASYTEGMFGLYNRDQVVPSALSSKYLSSRSALQWAMKSAMGLGFKRKRETRYEHREDCQMPMLYTKRKDDRSFIKESSRVKKETSEIRDFCRVEPNCVLT